MSAYTILHLAILGYSLFGPDRAMVSFTPGFPVAIPMTGRAIVHGKARAEPEFELRVINVRYWENGCELRFAKVFRHPDGTYLAVLTGLRPGVEYFVEASAETIREDERVTFANIRR